MAALTTNAVYSQSGPFTGTEFTLSDDDTIPYDANRKQLLVLRNPTGGTLTATIDGDGGTTANVDGLGVVTVSGGLAIAVPTTETRIVELAKIRLYCQGVVHITGASGMKGYLLDL